MPSTDLPPKTLIQRVLRDSPGQSAFRGLKNITGRPTWQETGLFGGRDKCYSINYLYVEKPLIKEILSSCCGWRFSWNSKEEKISVPTDDESWERITWKPPHLLDPVLTPTSSRCDPGATQGHSRNPPHTVVQVFYTSAEPSIKSHELPRREIAPGAVCDPPKDPGLEDSPG